jgi:hypothetical protein
MLTVLLDYMLLGVLVMAVLVCIEPPISRTYWLQLPLCVLLWPLSLGLFIYRTWGTQHA